jgi:hypothetical protein
MSRPYLLVVSLAMLGCSTVGASADAGDHSRRESGVLSRSVTWHNGVGALLSYKCVTCHNGTALAPVDLRSIDTVRSLARLVRPLVVQGVMPPLSGEGSDVLLDDPRALSNSELTLLLGWLDNGAPTGSPGEPVVWRSTPAARPTLPDRAGDLRRCS